MSWDFSGALGGTRTPNLLIRRCPYRRPIPFGSVRDLGLLFFGCPDEFGRSEGSSSVWLPVWLPPEHRAKVRLGLVSDDDKVGPLGWLLRSNVSVLFGHPYLGPLVAHRFAVSLDTTCHADRARRLNPDGQVPAIAQLRSGGRYTFDDDSALGGNVMPFCPGVGWPVPPLVAGVVSGQERIEGLAPEALPIPARHGRAREVVQADYAGVVQLLGDAGRESALACSPWPIDCDEQRSRLAAPELFDALHHIRYGH
jgi:hypothetical protein